MFNFLNGEAEQGHVQKYAGMCMCVCIYIYVSMYICIYVCIYICIHRHLRTKDLGFRVWDVGLRV